MERSLARIILIALLLPLLLSGCGMWGTERDETIGWSAQRLYGEAKSELDAANYETAVKYYEKLEARYPFGRFAQQAQMDVAYAYFKKGDVESAIPAADRFIKQNPNHPNVDYIYYLKGLVHFSQDLGLLGKIMALDQSERDPKAMREAFDAFKDLSVRFPDSKYTADALLRMKFLVNLLSEHETNVARYYYKRGAYVASSSRAKYTLETYPQTPATEEALFLMVKSYDALGMNDLRDDADRIMRKNFPNSAYLKGTADNSTPWWKLWR
jgi:outer membrane protein assembly factor BamD